MDEKEAFGYWITQFQLKERTVKLYQKVVNSFLDYLGDKKLNQENINRFLKDHPREYHVAGMRKYLDFKGSNLKIPKVKPKPKKKHFVPSYTDFDNMLKTLKSYKISNMDNYWLCFVLFKTGCRVIEGLELKLKNINFEENYILFEKTKTDQERNIVINDKKQMDELKEYLLNKKGILGGQKCFYTNYKNTEHAYNDFRKYIDKLVENQKISEDVGKVLKRTHNFRRAWTSMIYKKLKDPYKVQIAKGDSDIRNTITYLGELDKEDALNSVNALLLEDDK